MALVGLAVAVVVSQVTELVAAVGLLALGGLTPVVADEVVVPPARLALEITVSTGTQRLGVLWRRAFLAARAAVVGVVVQVEIFIGEAITVVVALVAELHPLVGHVAVVFAAILVEPVGVVPSALADLHETQSMETHRLSVGQRGALKATFSRLAHPLVTALLHETIVVDLAGPRPGGVVAIVAPRDETRPQEEPR